MGNLNHNLDFMLHVSLLWRIGYEAKAYTSFVLCWKYFLFVCLFFLYESCFEYMNISCVYNRIHYQRLIKLIIIIIIIIITIIVIIITVLIMMILLTV